MAPVGGSEMEHAGHRTRKTHSISKVIVNRLAKLEAKYFSIKGPAFDFALGGARGLKPGRARDEATVLINRVDGLLCLRCREPTEKQCNDAGQEFQGGCQLKGLR